jgi:O-antigen/teichoic acid export membrane protein
VFLPRLTLLVARRDYHSVTTAYVQGSRVASAMAAFLLTNLVILGPAFLRLWAGEQFGTSVLGILVCLAVATLLHVFLTIVALPFYQVLNLLKVAASVLLLEALLNLVCSIVLARYLGLFGVALSTVIPAFCVSFMILPRYLCRKMSISLLSYLSASLVPAVLIIISVAAAHWLGALYIPADSYPSLAARVLLSLLAAMAVGFASLSSAEQQAILRFAKLRSVGGGE